MSSSSKRKRTRTSTISKRRRRRSDVAEEYIDKEATAPSDEGDDEPEDVTLSTQGSEFFDESSIIEGNSPGAHRAVDRLLEQQEDTSITNILNRLGSHSTQDTAMPGPSTSEEHPRDSPELFTDASAEPTQPYFPAAFATSQQCLTHFNFNLFVFDTLTLPRGLFPDDEHEEVRFNNAKECTEYCERYAEGRLAELEHSREEDHSEERRAHLSKSDMFRQTGKPIKSMTTGNAAFDANLDNLRIDIYGNVMILNAPPWSDVSPQFTHGFPRRLIRESHRGMFPENLTISARISNQAIRSLSIGDMACFISRKMIEGLGLTQPELVLARTSAIKYAGRHQKPSRLIDMMLRVGIDFLTMKPLTSEQTRDLRSTSTLHWNEVLNSAPTGDQGESDSGTESSGNELEIPSSFDVRDECGDFLPEPASATHTKVVNTHVRNLLSCYVSTVTATSVQAEQVAPPSSGTRKQHSSGQRRKRKEKTAQQATPANPPAGTSTSTAEAHPRRRELRAALEAVEGIVPARIPQDDSLARLTEYLRNNQPLSAQQATVVPEESQATSNLRLQRFQASYRANRSDEVKQAKKQLWDACTADCLCEADSSTRSSQGTQPGENCPYCQAADEGAEICNVARKCGNQECRVCELVDHCEIPGLVLMGVNRNARLTALLQLSRYLVHILNSSDIDQERMAIITNALCSLLCCRQTKLRNVANTGFLAELCPNLVHVQLSTGWANLWSNLSKIASAVGHHQNRHSQLAALIFIREKCLPEPENHWHYYLQSADETEEQEVREAVFHECFEEEAGSS